MGETRIRRGRKFGQVLEGAREIFLRDGFEGANVDEIARAAQVSKATLYSYFPDKRLLFMEVVRVECAHLADAAVELTDVNAAPEDVLTRAGGRIVDFIMSPFGRAIYRLSVAESDRFPELGRRYYESGPLLVRARLVGYLQAAVARGELEIPDLDLAADQFAEMCRANIQLRVVLGIDEVSAADRARTIAGAVEVFLARYRVRPPHPVETIEP
ncbi:TetR/AcrR family transcriptional regulator [Phaeovulum vinaykumarii]|uniref:Transcriptional regulator, TetR family n=1 Tax=Phaeovulum vinaykumarii TaxID=407234 RepID=A0A1N7L121_9RHOB|nr:TetR/AcrR family transcriptional regulator [Phaeovulum vinaykumarii]SIS67548.1 transcriptional regulator, TetR family [Phaeovulum vinaykumarii]SOC00683.1 TetR family transcriptional regulator [Phaeovulum vinaykumarii]